MNQDKIFGAYFDRNVRLIKRAYLRAFKENDIDLTPEQWVLVDHLHREDGCTQNELAADSLKDAPTVSRIIDLLQKKGFLERRKLETDRRSSRIYLTEAGREIFKKGLPVVVALREKGWQGLTEGDYQTFLRLMNRIYNNMQS